MISLKVTGGEKHPELILKFFKEQEKKYHNAFAVYVGPIRQFLRIYNPQLIKQILHASGKYYKRVFALVVIPTKL